MNLTLSPIVAGVMRLGVWGSNFTRDEMQVFIEKSLELGISTFDHADIYGDYSTEQEFGDVLRHKPSLRQDMQLISKCGIRLPTENRPENKIYSYDSRPFYIVQSVEKSLKNLGTDYLDGLLIHRPDFLMHPADIARAVERLKEQGKIRWFGVSNFSASQMDMLHRYTPIKVNQVEVSLMHLDPFMDGSLDTCMKLGIQPMAWSPLAGGSFFRVSDEERVSRIMKVATPLVEKYQIEIDQLLLAWVIKHPSGIIPVMGSSKVHRLESATKALQTNLEHEDWYALWQASKGQRLA